MGVLDALLEALGVVVVVVVVVGLGHGGGCFGLLVCKFVRNWVQRYGKG